MKLSCALSLACLPLLGSSHPSPFPGLMKTLSARTSSNHHPEGRTSSVSEKRQHGILGRRLQSADCESAYMTCLDDASCNVCANQLVNTDVDVFDLDASTSCDDLLDVLDGMSLCTSLQGNQGSKGLFCNLFQSCLDDFSDDYEPYEPDLDCSKLTTCDWSGINREFLGDGICDQWTLGGCYNTAICGYDGGDCCEDKCNNGDSAWAECGSNGFYCADPESAKCDPAYNSDCPPLPTPAPVPIPTCSSGEHLFKLMQYDSWGDGWDSATMTLKQDNGVTLYSGTLEEGSEGTQYACLTGGCYNMILTAGDWGNEISWEVKRNSGGAAVASGGAPVDCKFPVEGDYCVNTCSEATPPAPAPIDPSNPSDEDEQMQCIAQQCAVQIGTCASDVTGCALCLASPSLSWCNSNPKFEHLISCAMCHCTEGHEEACDNTGPPGPQNLCNAQQTVMGGNAAYQFQTCSDIGGVDNLIVDWDEDNFGALDIFESCAHTYNNEPNHGGKKAEDCMQVLYDAAHSNSEKDIVKEIAGKLYTDPGGFCDCSSAAWSALPNCDTFSRLKVLVHETLDACTSLDQIDCDAWREFSNVCENKLVAEFGSIDFFQRKQCDYIKDGCGGSGPFPSFRKLDCGSEIPSKNWVFWQDYVDGCVTNSPAPPSPTPPTPTPPTPTPPTPTPPTPTDDKTNGKTKAKSSAAGPVIGVLVSLGFVCGGAVFYKKRRDNQAFASAYRYRPQRDSELEGSELFSGLSVNSGSFKPPTLPPQTHDI